MNLLKVARSREVNTHAKKVDKIEQKRLLCQKFMQETIWFKVTLPPEQKKAFGDHISVDLMVSEEKKILHIVTTAADTSADIFIDAQGAS